MEGALQKIRSTEVKERFADELRIVQHFRIVQRILKITACIFSFVLR